MSAGVGNFRELVAKAHSGELKLPGFQRNWRWRTDKVIKLYDSLRLRYPIGSFLFLAGQGSNLSPRAFNGASKAAMEAPTEYLVLDGQQRLTSGIHIFHATGIRQYYIDLNRLEELVAEREVDIKNEERVLEFCRDIDFEDGYLRAKSAVSDPRSLLIKNDLLCTNILTNATQFNVAAMDYLKVRPERSDLIYRIVQPHFSLNERDAVPHININERTSISAISRIFTTLNTTGQMLTPFELVVASLFPSNIDLQKEAGDFREVGTYYPNMDKTGEILLQTIAMLADVDQKKANLPRNITATNYTQHKALAFDALEDLGRFLSSSLGCGLDVSGELVPYDAIYAPMARALLHIKNRKLAGPDLAEAHNKLRLWFAASALTQRYQEGVHGKQVRDFKEMVAWIDGGARPAWINEARTPALSSRAFEGAIGKFIQCCINLNNPRDPVMTSHMIGFRSGAMTTEKHHVFPVRFVQHLEEWDKKVDKADNLLNMMFVWRDTNKNWLNHDPRDHINEAMKNTSIDEIEKHYLDQFISREALDVLRKPKKSRADFYAFLDARQACIQAAIKSRFGISPLTAEEALAADDTASDEELLLAFEEA